MVEVPSDQVEPLDLSEAKGIATDNVAFVGLAKGVSPATFVFQCSTNGAQLTHILLSAITQASIEKEIVPSTHCLILTSSTVPFRHSFLPY